MIIIFKIERKIGDKQTEILNSITEQLSFESIVFPHSIEKAITLIQKYSKQNEKNLSKYYLHIYTDVPGYAIFSNNKLWNEFYDILDGAKKKFFIIWHFYSENKLNEHINKQFNTWKSYDEKKVKDRIEESVKNIYKKHTNCSYFNCKSNNLTDCKIIQDIQTESHSKKSVEDMVDFIERKVKKLHECAINQINKLTEEGGEVKIERIEEDLPFFGWIFGKKEKNAFTPLEGIISYSFYSDEGEEREKGFSTSDRKLIRILYEIINNSFKKT